MVASAAQSPPDRAAAPRSSARPPLRVLGSLLLAASACAPAGDPGADPDAGAAAETADHVDATPRPDGSDDADSETGAPDAPPADANANADADVPLPEGVVEGDGTGGIVIATWNVARFFDTQCASGRCGEDDFERALSPAQFTVRINEIAGGIEQIDADVLLLQEIENETCLDALVDALGPAWTVAVFGETGVSGSLDVATLARGELVDVVRHGSTPLMRPGGSATSFTREFLETRIRIDGIDVTVFNAHFKSQNGDDPGRRLAEAQGAAAIVSAAALAQPNAIVVLGGDLNDTPGSDAIGALDASGRLLRVAGELGDDAATIEFFGEGQAIDHLYLALDASGAYVRGSAAVVRRPAGIRLADSDHAALRATFVAEDVP